MITMTEKDFIPKAYAKSLITGSVTWESPSNIALDQILGKKERSNS